MKEVFFPDWGSFESNLMRFLGIEFSADEDGFVCFPEDSIQELKEALDYGVREYYPQLSTYASVSQFCDENRVGIMQAIYAYQCSHGNPTCMQLLRDYFLPDGDEDFILDLYILQEESVIKEGRIKGALVSAAADWVVGTICSELEKE